MRKFKLEKIECEICGEKDKKILHKHHIIPSSQIGTTNDYMNLVVVCPTCHSKIHTDEIEIVGVYPSTNPPHGRLVIWKRDGKSNFPGIDEPYYKPKMKQMRVPFVKDEEENETK